MKHLIEKITEVAAQQTAEEIQEATDLYNKGGLQITRYSAGKGKLGVQVSTGFKKYIQLTEPQMKTLAQILPKIQRDLRKDLKKEDIDHICESKFHVCAVVVEHPEWGVGKPIIGRHAEPDDDGNVEWYDVEFAHGIEEKVYADGLNILDEMNHGKKKKASEDAMGGITSADKKPQKYRKPDGSMGIKMVPADKRNPGMGEDKMDPVGKADADIDNDGDVDKSDKYLHNRRKAIKKAMGKGDPKGENGETAKMNPKKESVKEDPAHYAAIAKADAKYRKEKGMPPARNMYDKKFSNKNKSVKKESTMTFREKLISVLEGDRAAHYKGATEPDEQPMDRNASAKKMKDGHKGETVDKLPQAFSDVTKAGKVTNKSKARNSGDAVNSGDQKIIPGGTPMNKLKGTMEAYASMYAEEKKDVEEKLDPYQRVARDAGRGKGKAATDYVKARMKKAEPYHFANEPTDSDLKNRMHKGAPGDSLGKIKHDTSARPKDKLASQPDIKTRLKNKKSMDAYHKARRQSQSPSGRDNMGGVGIRY